MDKRFRRQWKASNKHNQRHFILGGGFYGLLPDLILGNIHDSLLSAIDRYTYTVSVPNLYHSVGRQPVGALKEEAEHERHKASLAWH